MKPRVHQVNSVPVCSEQIFQTAEITQKTKKSFVTGKLGEKLASMYLQKKGYKIIAMNYHGRWGELDIVAGKDQKLVFVEVKTRKGSNFGPGSEAFDWQKKKRLLRTIGQFLKHNSLLKVESNAWQLDLIEIEFSPRNQEKGTIKHFQNVLED